jgi:hypothetical protein
VYASHEPGVVTKSSPIVDEYQLIDKRDLKWSRGESDSLFVEFEHFQRIERASTWARKAGFRIDARNSFHDNRFVGSREC